MKQARNKNRPNMPGPDLIVYFASLASAKSAARSLCSPGVLSMSGRHRATRPSRLAMINPRMADAQRLDFLELMRDILDARHRAALMDSTNLFVRRPDDTFTAPCRLLRINGVVDQFFDGFLEILHGMATATSDLDSVAVTPGGRAFPARGGRQFAVENRLALAPIPPSSPG